ncbi:MAG: hypothetical protein JNL74_16050 [Fibrobacteres bacterium]|nr:hypothetical protein [Fibrobacterota bacterium]
MDDILNVLSERIERAIGEINRLKGELSAVHNEKNGMQHRVSELENRVRELEGEKEMVNNQANEKFNAFTGRVEEIIRKLDNIA